MNLDNFLNTLKTELPPICTSKDLIRHVPVIFKNEASLTRMRAQGISPPYFRVPPHIHFLRDDVIAWLKGQYQCHKMPKEAPKKKKPIQNYVSKIKKKKRVAGKGTL